MRSILLFTIFIFNLHFSVAQNGIDFTTDKQFYLKGSSKLIGNSILESSSQKDNKNTSLSNDAVDLKYIDVDTDDKTFSSSQANLQIPENKKIKYAALYWSAIYKYDIGVKKVQGKTLRYVEKEKSLSNIDKVYFKTPDSDYQTIYGTFIFDSKSTNLFDQTKPYLCFADVTKILQDSKTTNGGYTVANIKATNGYVYGGSSGGWVLYVIYENEEDTKKYFTTYNGFVGINKGTLTIPFSDFKTNEEGPVNTSLLLASLEGDSKIKTDKCAIINAEKKAFKPLFTNNRKEYNFFNSTISSIAAKDRYPSNLNTFGLDLLKLPIPNKNNSILSNNSTNTSIKLSTNRDGFYLFFVAFETEISESFTPEKKNSVKTEAVTKTPETTPVKVVKTANQTITIQEPKPQAVPEVKNTKAVTIANTPKPKRQLILSESSKLETKAQPKYVLVTNAFSIKDNAIKWRDKLFNQGYNPKLYLNPENNLHYVYISEGFDPVPIYQERMNLLDSNTFDDLIVKQFFL